MSASIATGSIELKPWQIGDLRLTAFPSSPPSLGARTEEKLWEELVGTKPESVISSQYGKGVDIGGPFRTDGRLIYRRLDRAIEWMLAPVQDLKIRANFLKPIAIDPFVQVMSKWLTGCPPLQRLAFGAALYEPVKNRAEAYERLESFLHLGLKFSEDEGDFLYQYNRRRHSRSMPEVMINRVTKWTWVPLGEFLVRDGKLVHPEESACLLELDINTGFEFQNTFPPDRCVPLFEELVGMAAEIAARGDVP